MIDSDVMGRMYAQIVQGIAKEDSTLVADEEHSAWWDEVAAEVASMREADPTVIFEVPGEVPSIAGALPDQPAGQPEEPGQTGQPEEPGQTGQTGQQTGEEGAVDGE